MNDIWAEVTATDTRIDLTVQRVVGIDPAAADPHQAWREALTVVTGVPAEDLEVRRITHVP